MKKYVPLFEDFEDDDYDDIQEPQPIESGSYQNDINNVVEVTFDGEDVIVDGDEKFDTLDINGTARKLIDYLMDKFNPKKNLYDYYKFSINGLNGYTDPDGDPGNMKFGIEMLLNEWVGFSITYDRATEFFAMQQNPGGSYNGEEIPGHL